jgi:enoyl-CoA hydratase/carnithine racemase
MATAPQRAAENEPILLRSEAGGVVTLTLNRPRQFNALSEAMLDALTAELEEIGKDPSARVVVLAGAGDNFCAGHDLKEMRARPDQDWYRALFGKCIGVMKAIAEIPQPVIARAQGIATAAGCQLVASCDLAVAAEGTRFGVNGVNIGLFCSTPMVALSRAVPPKAAFEMLTTGEFIDATRARELGLINRVVPAEQLADAAMEMAQLISSKLPAAVRMGKQAFYRQLQLGLGDAYGSAGGTMCENMMLPDTDEGITAFLEKRKPSWA